MKKYWGLLLGLLPLGTSVYWHIINNAYPRNDEAFYFEFSQRLYLYFRDHSFLESLWNTYISRSWKPILHPVIGTATLFLSQGKVLLALALATELFYGLFILYAFLLGRYLLGGVRGVVFALWISWLPWVFSNSLTFSSEMPLLLAGIGVIYHGLRSDFSKNRTHTYWGFFWLALGICFRPVETVFSFSLAFGVYSLIAISRRQIHIRDLLVAALITLIVFATFVIRALSPRILPVDQLYNWFPLLLLPIPFYRGLKNAVARSYLWGFNLSAAIVIFWYGPHFQGLASWTYDCAFGLMAHKTGRPNSLDVLDYLRRVNSSLGLGTWIYFGIIFLIFGILNLKKIIQDLGMSALVLSIVITPQILGIAAHSADPRYHYLFAIVANVSLGYLVLSDLFKFPRIRLALFSIPLLLNFCFSISLWNPGPNLLTNWTSKWLSAEERTIYAYPKEDAFLSVTRRLQSLIPATSPRIGVVMTFQHKDLDWVMDPWALTIAMREQNLDWIFERPHLLEFSDDKERLDHLLSKYDYLVVAPKYGEVVASFPISGVGKNLTEALNKNQTQKMKIELIDQFEYFDRNNERGEMVLFKNLNPHQYE